MQQQQQQSSGRKPSKLLRKNTGIVRTVREYLPDSRRLVSTPSYWLRCQQVLFDTLHLSQWYVGSTLEKELDENDFDQFSNARKYRDLQWHHSLFVMLDDPDSSIVGKFWSAFVAIVTLISVLLYIVESVPELLEPQTDCEFPVCSNDPDLCPGSQICEPGPSKIQIYVETECIYIFMIDYFSRILLCAWVPSHLAGVADKQLQLNDPTDLDVADDVADPASDKHHSGRNLWPEEKAERDAERCKRKELKELIAKQTAKHKKWEDLAEEASNSDNLLLKIRLAFLRPVTELSYNPEQDPIFPWYEQLLRYVFKIINLIDFLAILPFFLMIAQTQSTSFSVVRVLRLARVLRILKLSKKSEGLPILTQTVVDSLPALAILSFFSLIGVVLIGSLQYFFESGTFQYKRLNAGPHYYRLNMPGYGSEVSPFTSIPMSMYWTIITSTTVGYGDVVPTSYAGRLLAIISAYLGMFVLALPVSVIGNNFERIYDSVQGNKSSGVAYSLLDLVNGSADLGLVESGKKSDGTQLSLAEKRRLVVQSACKQLASVFIVAKALMTTARIHDLLSQLREMHVHIYIDAMVYLEEERLSEKLLGKCEKGEQLWVEKTYREHSGDVADLELPTSDSSENFKKWLRFEDDRSFLHLELETSYGQHEEVVQRLVNCPRALNDETYKYYVFRKNPQALRDDPGYVELTNFVDSLVRVDGASDEEKDESHKRLSKQLEEAKQSLEAVMHGLEQLRHRPSITRREQEAEKERQEMIKAENLKRKAHGQRIFPKLSLSFKANGPSTSSSTSSREDQRIPEQGKGYEALSDPISDVIPDAYEIDSERSPQL